MTSQFPAYNGDDSFVFVCYSHADGEAVSAELSSLHEQGLNAWYDEGISPGHVFTDEIADRITKCSTFLYFVSPRSVASRNCQNEVQFAFARDKRIVAIHLEPTELSGGLELQIGLAQAILRYRLSAEDYHRKLSSVFAAEQLQHTTPVVPKPAATSPHPARWFALAALLVLVTGALGWYFLGQEPAVTETPSIAVLPFTNLSASEENGYFAEGMAEDILNGLSRVKGLLVVSRTSAFNYRGDTQDVKAVGLALGVMHVLEGSVQRSDNRARINVALVETKTGRQVWSNQYNREISDVFAVQDEISAAVLSALRVQLAPDGQRQSITPEAYDAYLRGRAREIGEWQAARADFEQALAIEPDYADAHALLGWTYIDAIPFGGRPAVEGYAAAQLSMGRALAINPNQIDAILGASMIHGIVNNDWQTTLDEIAALAQLDPQNLRYSFVIFELLTLVGRCDVGLPLLNELILADPLNKMLIGQKARCLTILGRYDDARQALESDSEPNGHLELRVRLIFEAGSADEKNRMTEELRLALGAEPWLWRSLLRLQEGDSEQSHTYALNALDQNPSSIEAMVLSGQVDRAIRLLEQRLDQRSFLLRDYLVPQENNYVSQQLHAHPDMQRLREKANLDDASLAKLEFKPLVY